MRKIRRSTAIFCILLLFVLMLTQTVSAAGNKKEIDGYLAVPVCLDGKYSGKCAYVLQNGVTYMTLREAASLLFPDAAVGWDSDGGFSYLKTDTLSLTAAWGEPYICANGRYFALSAQNPAENKLVDGTTYVPLRLLAKAADAAIDWNAKEHRVELTSGTGTVASGDSYYNKDDLYWLSHIIYAEAGNQPLTGQLAVGAVIMNRVRGEQWADSIWGVIFDNRYGTQFTPTANGTIYQNPSKESVIAAKLVLDGCSVSDEALYFLDPKIATNFWIPRSCTLLFSIGDHDFYS